MLESNSPHSPVTSVDRLDSAILRPINAAWYDKVGIIEQAVILAIAISQAQAFVDGNKRTAFGAADVFLRLNGMAFSGHPLIFAVYLERVARADRSKRDAIAADFTLWVKKNVATLEDPAGDPSA